jgi:hypothetical protein
MSRKASIAIILSALVLFAGGLVQAAPETANGPDVSQLLLEAKSRASMLKIDISTGGFFASSENGWKTHTAVTGVYNDRIAALRALADKLMAARNDSTYWQKETIDRTVPLLRGFAASASAMFANIDKNQTRLGTSEYNQYLKVNADLAVEFSDLIRSNVDYGKTMEQLQGLAEKVGAPAGPF